MLVCATASRAAFVVGVLFVSVASLHFYDPFDSLQRPFFGINHRVSILEPALGHVPTCPSTFNGATVSSSAAHESMLRSGLVCEPLSALDKRYGELAKSNERIVLAANLFNNEAVIPAWIDQIPRLARFLGTHRVRVVIFENGSEDETPYRLVLLAQALDHHDIGFKFHSGGKAEASFDPSMHRIEHLAAVRNKLLDAVRSDCGIHPHHILFLNDVFFCPADALELLLQHSRQGADMVCGLDMMLANGKSTDDLRFRDEWVFRDLDGRPLYPEAEMRNGRWEHYTSTFSERPDDHNRFGKLLPIQVFSCWDGMALVTANIFFPPTSLSFRTARDGDPNAHSECLLISADLWQQGRGRILVAPRAQLVYPEQPGDGVAIYARAQREMRHALHLYCYWNSCGPSSIPWSEEERVEWQLEPPAQLETYPGSLYVWPQWKQWDGL